MYLYTVDGFDEWDRRRRRRRCRRGGTRNRQDQRYRERGTKAWHRVGTRGWGVKL